MLSNKRNQRIRDVYVPDTGFRFRLTELEIPSVSVTAIHGVPDVKYLPVQIDVLHLKPTEFTTSQTTH